MAASKKLIFEKDERVFYEGDINNGLWRQVTDNAMLSQVASLMLAAALRLKFESLLAKSTSQSLRGIIDLVKGITEQDHPFDKSKGKTVHLANGHLDVRTDELLPHNVEAQSRNLIRIKYDPEAKCPRFLNELLGALPPDDLKLLQMWGGQVLLGINLAQKLLILDGLGGGGKSTFLLIMESLLGEMNVAQLRIDHLGKQFELVGYVDKLLLLGVDVSPSIFSSKYVGALKSLVGGDRMDVEFKGGNKRSPIRGNFGVGISCNGRPQFLIEGDASAWKRRMLSVTFPPNCPAKKIPNFHQMLIEEEGSGILNFFVEGAKELLVALGEDGEFPMSPRQKNIVAGLVSPPDVVEIFLEECLVKDPDEITFSRDLLNSFYEWCVFKGHEVPAKDPQLQARFCQYIESHLKISKRNDLSKGGQSGRSYKGLKVVDFRTGRTGVLNFYAEGVLPLAMEQIRPDPSDPSEIAYKFS